MENKGVFEAKLKTTVLRLNAVLKVVSVLFQLKRLFSCLKQH